MRYLKSYKYFPQKCEQMQHICNRGMSSVVDKLFLSLIPLVRGYANGDEDSERLSLGQVVEIYPKRLSRASSRDGAGEGSTERDVAGVGGVEIMILRLSASYGYEFLHEFLYEPLKEFKSVSHAIISLTYRFNACMGKKVLTEPMQKLTSVSKPSIKLV